MSDPGQYDYIGCVPTPLFYRQLNFARDETKRGYKMDTMITSILGAMGYIVCLVLYIIMLGHADAQGYGPLHALLITVVALHAATGVCVMIDAYVFNGSNILFQALIQAMGSYITFSLASFGGFWLYVSIVNNNTFLNELVISFLALGCACVSNSLLLSMLFNYFHQGAEKAIGVTPSKNWNGF